MSYEHLRLDYTGESLTKEKADPCPIKQFKIWFAEVEACGVPLANGMTLATVNQHGAPSARVVLMKDIDDIGITFVSNYGSRKGIELDSNPQAALVFWWPTMHRQVRFEGVVSRSDARLSDRYFEERSRESNLSAMASDQSRPLASRDALERQVKEMGATWKGKELARPKDWGAYCLKPNLVEFWQGQPDRSHDRLEYRWKADSWAVQRLWP